MIYILNNRLPTEKAYGVQVANTCAALSEAGEEVVLLVPKRKNPITQSVFEYYKVPPNFEVKYLPCLDLVQFGSLGFLLQSLSFALSVFVYSFRTRFNIYYSRDPYTLFVLSFRKKLTLYFEAHNFSVNWFLKKTLPKLQGLVTITHGLATDFKKKFNNLPPVFVSPDGVDVAKFTNTTTKEKAREILGLPQDKKIAVYSGSFFLHAWKGVDVFMQAAKLLPDITFVMVGGTQDEVKKLKAEQPTNSNLLVFEKQPQEKVALFLSAADCLVLPNKKDGGVSEKYTSPLKLFEYMASNRPIVASDISSIREVLADDSAYFATPNEPHSFAEQVARACTNQAESTVRAAIALQRVQKFDWKVRARDLINFIK